LIAIHDNDRWAEHGALRVGWLAHAPWGRRLELGDCVSIFTPSRSMRLNVDATTRGHRYTGMVDGPAVSVLPPCSRLDLEETSPGPMLVMTLAGSYVRAALGGEMRLRGAPSSLDPYLHRLGGLLRNAFRVRRLPPDEMLEGIARELREHLCAYYSHARRRQAPRPLSSDRLERAKAHMQSHFGDNALNVEQVAAVVGLSPFHFTRLFTAATGKAPHAYLTQIRIAEASRLLGSTCLPIAEIAQRTGYATHAHFTGMFGRHVGMTPAAYRTHVRSERAKARQASGT